MSLDGIVVKSITHELKSTLVDGKIDKVYQPEKDEILLSIRSKGANHKLVLSASSNNPRAYLTQFKKSNPVSPPMFCMLLRKYLQGGKILDITQPSLERIIKFDIKTMDELGNESIKQLIIEIMGRHSNIILIDKESKKIIDSVKRVGFETSSIRQILPGLIYEYPPSQNKINPLEINKEKFFETLETAKNDILVYKFIYTYFTGLSPLIGKEICYKSHISNDTMINELTFDKKNALYESFYNIMSEVLKNNFNPLIINDNKSKEVVAFSSISLEQYHHLQDTYYSSISEVLALFYSSRDNSDRIKQKSIDLRKFVSTKLERDQKKLSKQEKELLDAEKREIFKIYGDLIKANIYRIDRSDKIELENFYSPTLEKIIIKLDTKLTPSQNAQKYYKKYSKLKNASIIVSKELIKTKLEIEYFENIIVSISNCTTASDLDEIRDELITEGYLKRNKKNKGKKKVKLSNPRHFISSDGYDIYVGKNNNQNDYLTLKFAKKNDIWLHSKNIPGSHVIIKVSKNEIPDTTIKEAALLSAYYSKASMSSNVPIDYTERKNVHKPNGAKPGMVIYDTNNTIYVTPKIEDINNIKQVEK